MNVIAGRRLIDFVILSLVSINNVDSEINHFRIYFKEFFFCSEEIIVRRRILIRK